MSELPQSSPSPILRSWQRCLHQGLLRQQSAELDLLRQGELSARQEQHRTLITCFQRFVLPLQSVVESIRPEPGQVSAPTPDCEVIELRGTYLPVRRLADFFGIRGCSEYL